MRTASPSWVVVGVAGRESAWSREKTYHNLMEPDREGNGAYGPTALAVALLLLPTISVSIMEAFFTLWPLELSQFVTPQGPKALLIFAGGAEMTWMTGCTCYLVACLVIELRAPATHLLTTAKHLVPMVIFLGGCFASLGLAGTSTCM